MNRTPRKPSYLTCGSFSFAAHEEEKDNIDRLGSPPAGDSQAGFLLGTKLTDLANLRNCHG